MSRMEAECGAWSAEGATGDKKEKWTWVFGLGND